jgi:hypothetical protein
MIRKLIREMLTESSEDDGFVLTLSSRRNSGAIESFMSEYESSSQGNIVDHRERYFPMEDDDGSRCYVFVELRPANGSIHLSGIRTEPGACKGKGAASIVMTDLVALADKHKVPMDLFAEPFGDVGGLSKSALIGWYRKFGFVSDKHDKSEMRRSPK